VTDSDFTSAACWGGQPVATKIVNAQPRQRVVVSGTITNARTVPIGSGIAYTCDLADGTGSLALVFLGRREIPGLVPGASCTVEGTARMVEGSLAVWNPRYRFDREAPL